MQLQLTGTGTERRLEVGGQPLGFASWIEQVLVDPDVTLAFHRALAAAAPPVCRFETPPLMADTLDRPFECVLLPDPSLARTPEPEVFERYFDEVAAVRFMNLGGDAELVVPCPDGDLDFSHLGAFLAHASDEAAIAFWQLAALALRERVGERPVWFSTAGDGVAWLHLRLDDRPKYYHHAPFRRP